MKTHVSLGNINIDVYMRVNELPPPGGNVVAEEAYVGASGAAANYAVAVSLYGHQAILVGHTGKLAESIGVLSQLQAKGVDVSLVRVHSDALPGIVFVVITADGERTMFTLRGANSLLDGSEVTNVRCDVLHVASRETRILLKAATQASTRMVSYDPGGSVARREGVGVVEAARKVANILYLNRLEYRYVSGLDDVSKAAKLLGGTLEFIIVKLGAEGAIAATRKGVYRVEAYKPPKIVDSTGAGDVFAAYMNAALADGYSVEEALQYASVAAGLKVSRRGAQSAPSREEVEEVLRRKRPRVWRYTAS